MEILLKRMDDRALRPSRSFPDDAGLDLYITDPIVLPPRQFMDLPTGWSIKIPDGYWGSVKARSSTFFKRGLIVHEGTIDSGYTGKLNIGVYNPQDEAIRLETGDRIAQIVLIPLVIFPCRVVDELPRTVRGPEGFGSTGLGR